MDSVFRLYSIGYAAENKPRNERFLNVIATEVSGGTDGEVTFNPEELRLAGTDRDGNTYEVASTVDATINCEWLPASSNRLTPPDIMRSELVEIWRLGDTDQFYWRCMGLRDNLRTLETVIYAFSASKSTQKTPLALDRCYFLEISTHDKLVTFSTSMANGEPYRYTAQFNTGIGQFILNDDLGNQFEMISRERILKMFNADGSFLDINKKRITLNADEQIQLICKGSTLTMNPTEILHKTQRWFVDAAGTTWNQVGAGVEVTTPAFDII